MLKDFKKFALQGNMFDMAVGIIIGGAFSGIVNSLVEDILMPLLSIFTQNIDFSKLFIALDGGHYATIEAAQKANVATINYGQFISGVLNFLIMAFVIFLIVRWINKLKQPQPIEEATKKECPYCLTEININATRCPNCTSNLTEDLVVQ